MTAQQTADVLFYNLVESELDQFIQSKEAIDTLIKFIENEDFLSLKNVLQNISDRQQDMLEQQQAA